MTALAVDLVPAKQPLSTLVLTFDAAAAPAAANDQHPQLPERLVPDLPPAVGFMLVGTFAWIIGAYLVTFWSDLQALEMVVMDIVYVSVYLGVPWLILKLEPKTGPNPTFAQSMRRGLQTFTGHLTGAEALAQILTIPVALAIATTAMCLVAKLA
jgi:hypothetical protein